MLPETPTGQVQQEKGQTDLELIAKSGVRAHACVCLCACVCTFVYVCVRMCTCVCVCVGMCIWTLIPSIILLGPSQVMDQRNQSLSSSNNSSNSSSPGRQPEVTITVQDKPLRDKVHKMYMSSIHCNNNSDF